LDRSLHDLDRIKERVGRSSAHLPLLLDVRLASTDVLEDLRDGAPQSSPVFEELREDLEESSHHVKESSHHVKESSHHVKESSHHLKESSHHVKESSHHLKESSHHVKGS
jgi:methyl-accepting chemotaxis protein